MRDAHGAERLIWTSDPLFQMRNEYPDQASIALMRDHLDSLTGSDME